ncbi:MAG: TonB-dependent receptor [Parvularculaceae bacterium]
MTKISNRAYVAPLLLSTALVAPVFTQSAVAQSDGSENDLRRDEIVVTASPFERTAEQTIVGTSVLDARELADRLENTIGETLRREPGVSSTFFGQGASRPIIRGLDGDRIRVLDAGIGTIDASVTSPDHFVTVDPATAQRVEIVRGPATLLYGSSAAGGVVNVINGRIPEERPDGRVDGSLRVGGSTVDDGVETAGSFDVELGALGDGALVFHGDGFHRDSEDFDIPGFAESEQLRALQEAEGEAIPDEEREQGTLNNSDFTTTGGSAGLSWVFDDGFFGVSATAVDSFYGIPGPGEEEEGEEGEEEEFVPEGAGVTIDIRQRRLDLNGEVRGDFGPFEKAKIRFGYADFEQTEFEPSGEAGTVFANEGWEGRFELVTRPFEIFGGEYNGAIGFQGVNSDFSAIGEEAFVPPTDSEEYGVFALNEWRLGGWLLELGGRYENTDREVSETGESVSFDSFSVSGGAGYAPREGWFIGVTGFRTERAPASEELFSDGPHLATAQFEIGDPSLDEEVALGVEATVRVGFERFAIAVNGFYTDYEDFIVLTPNGEVEDGLDVFEFLAEDATFRGFEAEVDAELFRYGGFDVHFDGQVDFVRADSDTGDLPRIPPLKGLVGIEARSPYLDLRAEFEAAAEQDRTSTFELPTDGYQTVNVSLAFRPKGESSPFEVSVSANNLNDEEIRLHTSFLKDVVPLPGRNFRIAATARF